MIFKFIASTFCITFKTSFIAACSFRRRCLPAHSDCFPDCSAALSPRGGVRTFAGVVEVLPGAFGASLFRSSFRSAQRFDIGDQMNQLFFGNLSFECRHDRLITFDNLRSRIQDRVADILVVGINGLTIDSLTSVPNIPSSFAPR